MVEKITKDLLNRITLEIKKEDNQQIIENDIINPIIFKFLNKFYVKILFSIFILNFVIILIILILIICNNFNITQNSLKKLQ
jgi:hypothetical protein